MRVLLVAEPLFLQARAQPRAQLCKQIARDLRLTRVQIELRKKSS